MVWNNRSIKINKKSLLLEELIKANGFDTGVGDYNIKDWDTLTQFLAKIDLNTTSKVFEIGCGSGAFLYSLKQHSGCTIYGIDYSQPLIKILKIYIDGEFRVCDAKDQWELEKNGSYYFTLVFNYFPDMEYVKKVIENSFLNLKTGGMLALLDLNNDEKEKEYHDLRKSYVTSKSMKK